MAQETKNLQLGKTGLNFNPSKHIKQSKMKKKHFLSLEKCISVYSSTIKHAMPTKILWKLWKLASLKDIVWYNFFFFVVCKDKDELSWILWTKMLWIKLSSSSCFTDQEEIQNR